MKQSFIFSRKDCQVQKVHLFEEHQRQWEVEGGNFAEVFKKFQYWWIPGAKEVKYYHKCPAISSSRLTFLMGFSLCFKPFWEQVFSQENWSITGSRTLIGHLKYLITVVYRNTVYRGSAKVKNLHSQKSSFNEIVQKELTSFLELNFSLELGYQFIGKHSSVRTTAKSTFLTAFNHALVPLVRFFVQKNEWNDQTNEKLDFCY